MAHPDGHALDISRTIGYATRAEAETVGQEYLAAVAGVSRARRLM